jgi:hypothetical protein
LPKLPENCFELVGKGGWPRISIWIMRILWVPGKDEYKILFLHRHHFFHGSRFFHILISWVMIFFLRWGYHIHMISPKITSCFRSL